MTIFFTFIIFFVLANPANAQFKSVLVPGLNCGVANDISKSKCCAPITVTSLNSYLPDFGPGFNTVRDLVLGPGFSFIKNLFAPWQDYQNKLSVACQTGKASTSDASDPNCRCVDTAPTPGAINQLYKYCDNLTDKKSGGEKDVCYGCVKNGGVWTGIGCVQGDAKRFISETVLGLGIGLAGGISLLCIIYAAFMMQTSQANPEKLKKAQELLTSCIMGLMLIIFSVFILRLIGVNILKIPGFS